MSDDQYYCIYCKIDKGDGQITSDNEFICSDCISDILGDDDE
jgi:hypothetical protein